MAAIFQIRRGTTDISSSIVDGELYLHKGKNSLQVAIGDGNPITLLALNTASFGDIILTGSAYISGNVVLGGNIYLGDNLANDSVNVNSPFSGSIIPSGSNVFDLGSNAYKYRNVNATSISGAIAATNGVISGSSQIISILDSLNSFSSSQLTQNSNLATISGSLILTASANVLSRTALNSFSSSQLTQNNNLATISGSLIGTASANVISITALNSFSSSQLTQNGALATISGSLISTASNHEQRLGQIESKSGSYDTRFNSLATISGSLISTASVNTISVTNLNSFSSSQLTENSNLATITGSLISTASANVLSIAELNSYTSSLKTAITASGADITINGNLTVKGTTTQIDSTTIQIGDNIIELNGTGIANGGLLVKDPTGGSTLSGSLLWDSTNDYWKGGTLSNESKLLRAGGDSVISGSSQVLGGTGIVSGSSQITPLLPTGIVSGSSQIPSLLPTGVVSGSSQIANLGYATTGSNSFYGNQIISGNIYLTGSIIPAGSASFDLGTASNPFRHLYVGSGSLYIGGNKALSLSDSGQLTIDAQPQADAVNIKGGNLNVYGDIVVHGDNTLLAIRNNSGSNIGAIQSVGEMANDITFEGQYSGTSGFVFRNTHPSCSRSSGNYASIKPDEILFSSLSGSIVINNTSTDIFHNTTLNLTGGTIAISGSSTTIQGVNFNTFSSSLDSRLTTLAGVTSSLNSYTASANAWSGTIDTRFTTLGTYTASVNQTTSSLNSYTASISTSFGQFSSSYAADSASFDYRIDTLDPGNLSGNLLSLQQTTASLNTFSASAKISITNIEAATSSYETTGRSIVSSSAQIVPLLPAGTVSGSSQVITSNAITLGTHTTGNYIQTITGTTNQITVAGSGLESADVTLSIPQNIHTSATPTFAGLTINGAITATGDITAYYSDKRLKDISGNIDSALDKVNQISGVYYKQNELAESFGYTNYNQQVVVIAQEIQSVLPEAIALAPFDRDENGNSKSGENYLTVHYEKIVPLLIEAIKELSAKVKELENK